MKSNTAAVLHVRLYPMCVQVPAHTSMQDLQSRLFLGTIAEWPAAAEQPEGTLLELLGSAGHLRAESQVWAAIPACMLGPSCSALPGAFLSHTASSSSVFASAMLLVQCRPGPAPAESAMLHSSSDSHQSLACDKAVQACAASQLRPWPDRRTALSLVSVVGWIFKSRSCLRMPCSDEPVCKQALVAMEGIRTVNFSEAVQECLPSGSWSITPSDVAQRRDLRSKRWALTCHSRCCR